MSKFNSATNSFGSGALGADLRARFDVPQYASGASVIENFLPRKTGGVSRRSGSVMRHLFTTTSTAPTEGGRAYITYTHREKEHILGIELHGRGTVGEDNWFAYDNGGVGDIVTVEEYDSASNVAPTVYEAIDEIQYAQLGKYLVVVDTKGLYTPVVYEYLEGYRGDGAAVVVDNFIKTGWEAFMGIEKPLAFGWLPPNTDSTLKMQTLALQGAAAGTLIAPDVRVTDTIISSNKPYFTPDMAGMFIRVHQNVGSVHTEGIAKLLVYQDANTFTCSEWVAFAESVNQWDDWAMSAFRAESVSGQYNHYPKCVAVYQDRLIFGGSDLAPDTVFMSAVGNPKIFMDLKLYQDRTLDGADYVDDSGMGYYGGVKATDAFSMKVTGSEGVAVQFIIGANVLFVGTTHRPYIIRTVGSEGFGPLTTEVISEKAVSCGSVQPVYTSEGFAYVSANRQEIHLGTYVENTGEYINKTITLLNNDISSYSKNSAYRKWWDFASVNKYDRSYIMQLTWDKEASVLWVLNSRGQLGSLTLEEGAKTAAWATHYIADGQGANINAVTVEAVEYQAAFVTSMTRAMQNLWLGTMRDTGTLNTYKETLESIEDMTSVAVDGASALRVSGVKDLLDMTTWEVTGSGGVYTLPDYYIGYTYLWYIRYKRQLAYEGENTYIVGRVAVEANNTIILPSVGDTYMIGINYKSTVQSMPFFMGDRSTTSVGDIMRVDTAFIMLYKTKYAKVFTEYNEEIIIDTSDDDELYTKTVTVKPPHSQDRDGTIGISIDIPYPCTVLGWTLRGVHYAD